MKNIALHFRSISIFSLMLLNFSCSPVFRDDDGGWTIKDITQERDMSRYDKGGQFYCNRWFEKDKEHLGEKKVCDFILQHLADRKRGYIKISCNGIDTSNTSHIFIEPDKQDKWNINVRIVGQHAVDYSNGKTIDSSYSSVECLENYSENLKWTLFYETKDGQKNRSL